MISSTWTSALRCRGFMKPAHRAAAGAELEIGQPNIDQQAQDLDGLRRHKEIAVPQHGHVEGAIVDRRVRTPVEPVHAGALGGQSPADVRRTRRETLAEESNGGDNRMQMDGRIAADPVDVMATLDAQQPGHRRQRPRIGERAVILIGADVAVLAKAQRVLQEVKKIVPEPSRP